MAKEPGLVGDVSLRERGVAVLQLPGSNCEWETACAVRAAGGSAEVVRWNEPAERLASFGAYVIPGGFSYQDRIRAGAVAARLPFLDIVAARAGEGIPVLGICNGAQVLVEAGLVPGLRAGALEVALGPNRMPGRDGYYTRWIRIGGGPAAERCLFTRGLGSRILSMPMAHAEGRFTTRDDSVRDRLSGQVALTYRAPDDGAARDFPWNPNGSLLSIAGLTNPEGNVLAMMPHPERAIVRGQIPDWLTADPTEDPEGPGPGLFLFQALVRTLGERP